jgi:hypothetical protein
LRTTAHLLRRSAYAAALALLATGAVSAPALADSTSPATLAPNDGAAFDGLGQSAAISSNGDVAAVGSPGHNASTGAVYVFTAAGSQTAELTPSDEQPGEQLGTSTAISADGQTVVSGADGAGTSEQGAAYVFTDQSGTWSQTAKLTAAGAFQLGTSVAISADASTIVVTAPFTNSDNGEAFVFTKSGSTYTQTQELTTAAPPSHGRPSPPPPNLLGFSSAVSSDGSTIVLGAPGTNGFAGAADVFTKSGSTWNQTAQLTGANTAASDNFGLSVAVSGSGTTVAAGSPASNGGDGSAYVFTESGGTFTQASQVLPPAGTSGASAGSNIGMSSDGTVVALGAPRLNNGAGAVFVATENNGAWALTATDTQPNPVSDDELGGGLGSTAVAGNGSAIVSGARGRDGDVGAAFLFPVS